MQTGALYILGDIHGDTSVIKTFLKENKIQDITIIQLGDFGIGINDAATLDAFLDDLNKALAEHQSQLFIIRGNHDNPAYFENSSGNKKDKSNIRFLSDYSLLSINNKNILCVGGAISIDRSNREADIDYFEQEEYQLDEVRINRLNNIDIVITHTAPDLAYPFDLGGVNHAYFRRDKTLRVDLAQERHNLTKMYDLLKQNSSNKLSHWFYGHFHDSECTQYDRTKFVLIDMDQMYRIELS